jgi:hypothetical protein
MAGRICKHEGCGRPVSGRGLCKSHYNAWNRANPGLTVMATNRQALLDAMPATIAQLVTKTGLCESTVKRQLAVLNKSGTERQAYIHDWIAPAQVGKKWTALYRQGNQPNKRLTPERKREHNKAMDRASAARRDPNLKPRIRPPRASWVDLLPAAA